MKFRDIVDFDIGIGWQTWGNYGSVRNWVFGIYTNEGMGEMTENRLAGWMITFLGFYFRIYVMDRQGRFWDKKQ